MRPYASREEFLQAEAEHLGRSHVTLIGVRERPAGTLVRFEITLPNGEAMVRAEGRVVGPREIDEQPALYVKLSRIDSRTRQLLEEATQRKRARASLTPVPPPAPSGSDVTGDLSRITAPPPPPSDSDVTAVQAAPQEALATFAAMAPAPAETERALTPEPSTSEVNETAEEAPSPALEAEAAHEPSHEAATSSTEAADAAMDTNAPSHEAATSSVQDSAPAPISERLAAGTSDVVAKPTNRDALLARLRSRLR